MWHIEYIFLGGNTWKFRQKIIFSSTFLIKLKRKNTFSNLIYLLVADTICLNMSVSLNIVVNW